jgi:DNA-binding transcriptional LysR family regulator
MKKGSTIAATQFDGIAAFLRVAERRSFRAAAADLGVSPSAVSQTIKALETRIGVALISRTTRSVGLTEAGQRFLDRARPAAEDFAAAVEAARSLGEHPSGLLRITVPRAMVAPVIEPVLADFCHAYPKIEVEIVADSGFVDIVEGGFDAGIRLGESLQTDMIRVRLTPQFHFCVVGTPDYLDRRGRPQRPGELTGHSCIRFRYVHSGVIYRWEFQENGRAFEVAIDGPVIVNEEALTLAMAKRGLGLAYVARPLVADALADGRLEAVLEPFLPLSAGVFLYYPSRAQMLPKLRAFVDFMHSAINRFGDTKHL